MSLLLGNVTRAVGLALIALALPASAERLTVAVASNFSATLSVLAERFERHSGHEVVLAAGATGKHTAQIIHGAPFDLFFAADSERPARLEAEGRTVAGTRITYALGRLALWSPDPDLVDPQGEVLAGDRYRRLAMANPRLAPYGEAARQVLVDRGLYQQVRPKLVRGENIGQTYQFVHSGAAELGFVAYSQLKRPGVDLEGSHWLVPADAHGPLRQQAVILNDSSAARAFLAFVQTDEARALIAQWGYDLPEATASP